MFIKELNKWVYSDEESFAENIAEIKNDISSADICWNHNCENPSGCSHTECSGKIAETFSGYNGCFAHIWHTKQGIYFLVKIDSRIKQCYEAYRRAEISEYQVSIWRKCYGKEISYDEIAHRYLRLCRDGKITEISLIKAPRDETTWVRTMVYT